MTAKIEMIEEKTAKEALLTSVNATFKAGLGLIEKKNADYGAYSDPFANFRTVQMLGITVEEGMLVRILDKIARINNLLTRDPQVVEESIEDSLLDAINYLALLKAYRELTPIAES